MAEATRGVDLALTLAWRFSRNAPAHFGNRAALLAAEDGGMAKIIQAARTASPYLLIELILPGGTLIALALWLYRSRNRT
ncbi:MAG TPA: hypothetical protein VEQ87_04925 [Burkholderiales bacterium]|nr:hypothetical protein [Burkholderiales bacterium]